MIADRAMVLPPRRSAWRAHLVAVLLIGGIGVLAGQAQYFVDPEVTVMPWLLSRGWVLYQDLIDHHTPLFPLALALLGDAGNPGWPLHAVVIGGLMLTLALVYGLTAWLAGPGAGIIALGLAAVWALAFDYSHLWYDGALAPIYLLSLGLGWGLLPRDAGADRPRPALRGWGLAFGLGGLLGLAILVKQHAALAVPLIILGLLVGVRANRIGSVAALLAGCALPLLGAVISWAALGALDDAWTWAVAYNLTGNYAASAAQPAAPGEWPVLAALYLPGAVAVLVAARGLRTASPPNWATTLGRGLLAGGLLLAATAPAWPRYGRYHFLAAVPLLAVAAGVAAARLWPAARAALRGGDGRSGRTGRLAILGLMLLGGHMLGGLAAGGQAGVTLAQLGPATPPYATSLPALRPWVDAHAVPAAPIFIYGLDDTLYRLLEREPPRPWVPQISWILKAQNNWGRLWAAVAQAHPPVVLISETLWNSLPPPDSPSPDAQLRRGYREAARFVLVSYPRAPAVTAVALVPNDASPP